MEATRQVLQKFLYGVYLLTTLFIAKVIKACWHGNAPLLSSEDYDGAYAG